MGPSEIVRPSSALSVSTSGRNSVLSVDRFLSDEKAERERELREARARAEELERRVKAAESESKRSEEEREEARRKAVEVEEKADSLEAEVRRLRADAERRDAASERRRTSMLSELEVVHAARLAELESDLAAKAATAEQAHATEKAELAGQLDELRMAGQSLCEVYEEKIANQAQARIVAEDEVHRLKGELAAAKEREAIRGGSTREEGGKEETADGAKMSEADLIDNEVLRADLKHARDRMSELQELLDGAREALANETASSVTKAQERGETQQKLKDEVRRLKEEVASREREKVDIKRRVGEVEAELKQAKRSQEDERSELEQLRSDAVVVQEVAVLRSRLDEALEQLAFAKIEVEEGKEREKGLREEVELMGEIKAEEGEQDKEEVRQLRKDLDARDEELRRLKRGSHAQTAPTNMDTGSQGATTPNKSLSPGGGPRDTTALSSSMGSRRTSGAGSGLADAEALAAMKEQIVGLKSIIARMTEERAELQQGQRRVQAEADELRCALTSQVVRSC